MAKLNFFSNTSLLLAGALVGLTLAACDLGAKSIGNENEEPAECKSGESKEDDCNTCTCVDGDWTCTELVCDGPIVECKDGDSKPSDDLCNTCTCNEGFWACTQKACDDGTSTTGGPDTDPSATTDSGATTVGTSTSTTVGTSTSTSTTDGPGDTGSTTDYETPPAVPCDGEAVPLADIPTIFAYAQSQLPPQPDTTTGTGSSTSGGAELDPGTLHVSLTNRALVCADPNPLLQCGGEWEVSIVIPPEFQSPGIYNLAGQDVRGFSTETGDEGGQDCSVGFGTFEATLEIISVDDKTVEGRLCHVKSLLSIPTPSLEGSFSAPRCQ